MILIEWSILGLHNSSQELPSIIPMLKDAHPQYKTSANAREATYLELPCCQSHFSVISSVSLAPKIV